MPNLVTNVYRNIPTDEKIKLYLKFCEYLTEEQMQYERNGSIKNDTDDTNGKGAGSVKCFEMDEK